MFVGNIFTLGLAGARAAEPGLVGHWQLQGDCRDYSGHENHGVNHGVDLDRGAFDGVGAICDALKRPG
jgi:hypothetical protein